MAVLAGVLLSSVGLFPSIAPPRPDELLSRVVQILHSNNPDLISKKRHSMKPPQLMRVGTKKTLWVNFQEVRGRTACGANGARSEYLRDMMQVLEHNSLATRFDRRCRFLVANFVLTS